MDTTNSIKEMVDQTAQTDVNPVYGARFLDLGGVESNPAPGTTNPLASSINSIPSYSPPPQNAPLPTFPSIGLPGPNAGKNPIGFGGIGSGISGLSGTSPFSFSFGSPTSPSTSDNSGSEFTSNSGAGGGSSNSTSFMGAFGPGLYDSIGGFA